MSAPLSLLLPFHSPADMKSVLISEFAECSSKPVALTWNVMDGVVCAATAEGDLILWHYSASSDQGTATTVNSLWKNHLSHPVSCLFADRTRVVTSGYELLFLFFSSVRSHPSISPRFRES